LKTSCPGIAFRFKTKELVVKNKYYSQDESFEQIDLSSINTTAHKIFNSMSGNYLPTLDEFSEYFGYSKRTIIRSFNDAGSSYKEMLENHLFMRALKLLGDHAVSVEEISSKLGYAHTSNFIRAFKRWSSTTPSKYRQQELTF
jgi:AraC-like DNA-binding protein